MTDTKKSERFALKSNLLSDEAGKGVNPHNAVPYKSNARSQRYLYGGMLFPSRILAQEARQTGEQDIS